MELKDFKQYYIIQASPSDVYNAMVNPNLIELWTDDEVVMEEKEGTEFSLYGGYIVGKNLEFEKNKISLSGKSIADYTKASYLTVFKDIEPQKKEILQLLPASTSAIFYSAIGDIALYTKQYDRYLNARQILHEIAYLCHLKMKGKHP